METLQGLTYFPKKSGKKLNNYEIFTAELTVLQCVV